MRIRKQQFGTLALAVVLALGAAGCKKKVPPPPPPPTPQPTAVTPPPPAPARPTVATFEVEPSTIERGQSATLKWDVRNANTVAIDNGIGTVSASGSRSISPADTTRYTLTASGEGGTDARGSVTLTVNAPSAPPPPPTPPTRGFSERLAGEVQDAYYDYDKSEIRSDAQAVLQKDAGALKAILDSFQNQTVVVEGHADERGSAEYNLALGDRRATAAKDFLSQLGVPADRLKVVSYGKDRPQCTEATEACYQTNRRAHFASGQ